MLKTRKFILKSIPQLLITFGHVLSGRTHEVEEWRRNGVDHLVDHLVDWNFGSR
jgi:hypothetical protein